MADIFISYSKADHALALKLSAYLEAEGWSVWWDKSLGVADLYRDEIMKQLVAASAVITIWTPNSAKSDWVRAEAGRAKAEGKLIPVKTTDVACADIPLPFGEMHTENVGSTELIRAAIVAQLAKPAIQVSQSRQITSLFKYQILTWIGIVGSAITLFANLQGVLNLADWAQSLAAHWHEWTKVIWTWVFSWCGMKVSKGGAAILSFYFFAVMTIIGGNINMKRGKELIKRGKELMKRGKELIKRGKELILRGKLTSTITEDKVSKGVMLFIFVCGVGYALIGMFYYANAEKPVANLGGVWLLVQEITITLFSAMIVAVMIYAAKSDRWRVVMVALLFGFMSGCLLMGLVTDEMPELRILKIYMFILGYLAVMLFCPLQQLMQRLSFVVLGVLTLIGLNEISKLNLHQYLQPPKVSENLVR